VNETKQLTHSLVCCRGKRKREDEPLFVRKKCYLLNGEKTVFFSATDLGFKLILDVRTLYHCMLLFVACRVSS